MPQRNVTFIPGEAAIIHCVADASPPPKYTWFKYDSEFNWAANTGRYTKWPNEGTLVFSVPHIDDDGIYQCTASNQFGRAMSVKISLRRAEMCQFKQRPIQELKLKVGESARLFCNVPVGYPSPVVTWQVRINNRIEYIKETNRFGTDIDGNLLIAAINYEENNAIFQCVANNEVMREQVAGPEYRIRVSQPESIFPIRIMYRTPRRTIAVEGDYLSLKCFYSGSPLPQYIWFKDDQPITLPNVKITNIGTLLEFKPVTRESAGLYRCRGSSESKMMPLDSDFEVFVKVRPKFIKYPKDTIVPVEGSVEFECTAEGDPQPSITWSVNGEDPAAYLDGVRKRIDGSKMILTNLTANDIAVIQCNASNPHGYDFVNAFVNVMREPPFFIEPPQKEIRVTEGSEVVINCQTFSGPPAVITWNKNDRPINGGRYKARLNGDLYIHSVSITDSGIYECIATNPYGTRKMSGTLMVRRKTSVVLAPYNTRIYEGDVFKFVCTAETDPAEWDNLKIYWYKDDNLIQYSVTPRIQPVWFDYSLIIGGAQPRDTGQYICNATNGLDWAWDTASLLVQGIPDQPLRVTVDCDSNIYEDVAIVKWSPGSDNYAPIIEYLVEYSTQYESDTWYPAELYNQTIKIQATDVKIKLRPHIRYRFRVRTRNRVGVSDPSVPTSDTCEILASIPDSNPKELYVYGTTDNNLIIKWTAMPYIEHNAPNLQYLIKAQCLDCVNIPRNEIASVTITNWRQDTYVFKSFTTGSNNYQMETYKRFNVTIQSFNDKGSSKGRVTATTGYSGENFPTLSPPTPTIIEAISTGFILEWPVIQKADLPNVLGYFRGYRIEWCEAGQLANDCHLNRRYQDVILQIPQTPILYGFLNRARRSLPAKEPRLSIAGMSLRSGGKEETKCDNKTRELILETNYPRSYSAMGAAVENVVQRMSRQAPVPSGVVDAIGTYTSAFVAGVTPFEWGKPLRVELRGVPGDKDIDLWLRIINIRFTSAPSATVSGRTAVGTPGPVSDLNVVRVNVNSIVVRWTPPIDPNGPVTGYQFGASEIRNLEIGFESMYPSVENPTLKEFEIGGLRPNTTYRLSVRPKTAIGTGISNYIDVATIPANQAPNPPTFIIDDVRNDSFKVTYEPSTTGLPGSVFYAQYRIPGFIWWRETQRLFLNRTFQIENLTSDTSYEVRVVATNGADLSTASKSGYTRTIGEARPGHLNGASATWFIVVFIFFILFLILFVLVYLGRKKRSKMLGTKAKEFAEQSNFGENVARMGLDTGYSNQRIADSIPYAGPNIGTNYRGGPGSLMLSEHNPPEYLNEDHLGSEIRDLEVYANIKSPNRSVFSDDIGSDMSRRPLIRNNSDFDNNAYVNKPRTKRNKNNLYTNANNYDDEPTNI